MTVPSIRIRGARVNNLRSVDVEIPRNRLVVVVGVSGSGKSSLVFDTIAAEAGHQLNETFPPYVRNRLPRWTRPDVDEISGLSPLVVIDQRRIGGNARSTVGTITETWSYLRLLYSRIGSPHVGESNHFSFNDAAGMCPTCSGLGEVVTSAVDRFLDLDRSLADGAILLPGFGNGQYWYRQYADIGAFDADTPLREWTGRRAHGAARGRGRRRPPRPQAPQGLRGGRRAVRADLPADLRRHVRAQAGRGPALHHHRHLPGVRRREAQRGVAGGPGRRPHDR